MIKTLSKAGREVNFLNLVKAKYQNTTPKSILNEEILGALTLMEGANRDAHCHCHRIGSPGEC